jgi:hypothetical protein
MISRMRNHVLAMFVIFWMVFLVTTPAPAGLIPSMGSSGSAGYTDQELNSIKQALENKIVKEKLQAYGLSSEEITSKLSSMSPDQIHVLAVVSSDVLAGGDTVTTIIVVFAIIAAAITLYALSGVLFGGSQK